VITIPAEPADAAQIPPALQPFGAVPPLVSDIDLSVDDRWLYVSCFATGELKQYDVSDPHNPKETDSIRLGGIVGRNPHRAASERRLAGGPLYYGQLVLATDEADELDGHAPRGRHTREPRPSDGSGSLSSRWLI
jgi:hypothetical protein